jgi:hypothetical protein
MSKPLSDRLPTADEFLFSQGVPIENYYLDRRQGFEVVCFTDENGREFYLHISNDDLHASVVARLIKLGVKTRQ